MAPNMSGNLQRCNRIQYFTPRPGGHRLNRFN